MSSTFKLAHITVCIDRQVQNSTMIDRAFKAMIGADWHHDSDIAFRNELLPVAYELHYGISPLEEHEVVPDKAPFALGTVTIDEQDDGIGIVVETYALIEDDSTVAYVFHPGEDLTTDQMVIMSRLCPERGACLMNLRLRAELAECKRQLKAAGKRIFELRQNPIFPEYKP